VRQGGLGVPLHQAGLAGRSLVNSHQAVAPPSKCQAQYAGDKGATEKGDFPG